MEKEIKIYHVETQEDYDDLMIELEQHGYKWISGDKPTIKPQYWNTEKEDTAVLLNAFKNYRMTRGALDYHKRTYPFTTVIKYKAGDTLELETDKAKELQKYSEQIAKKKEELSNKQAQDNHKLFNEIIADLEQTYIAKNKDYGNSFEESLNEFGEVAGLVRIGDKFNRAKNLSENKANVTDESKIDDLGAETGAISSDKIATDFTTRVLYAIVDGRMNKPTIVTTNLNSRELARMYDQKLISRILRGADGHVIQFKNTTDKRISVEF